LGKAEIGKGPMMTDKELLTSTLRKASQILRHHQETGSRNPLTTIQELIDLLDTPGLKSAVQRVEKGSER
jgi:hypothetical protein